MRRVLVIQDVGLWIELNRHLSGVASVDLVEAVSFETGQLLAQIERPEIVVYGPQADGPGPEALVRDFRAAGIDEIDVIAIDSAAPEPAAKHASEAPVTCAPSHLVELVLALLELTTEEPEAAMELLAHYELAGETNGEVVRGFAVILELSDRRLLFESDVPLETGSELDMNFFLTDAIGGSERAKISLSCILARCRDDARLIYSARVSKLTDGARVAVRRHVEASSGGAV